MLEASESEKFRRNFHGEHLFDRVNARDKLVGNRDEQLILLGCLNHEKPVGGSVVDAGDIAQYAAVGLLHGEAKEVLGIEAVGVVGIAFFLFIAQHIEGLVGKRSGFLFVAHAIDGDKVGFASLRPDCGKEEGHENAINIHNDATVLREIDVVVIAQYSNFAVDAVRLQEFAGRFELSKCNHLRFFFFLPWG